MVKSFWAIAMVVVVAALAPATAKADVKARYVNPRGLGALTIEVNDRGDSRAAQGNQQAFLTVGGVAYLVTSDLSGTYAVRMDDWIAVQAEAIHGFMKEKPSPAEAGDPPFQIAKKGTETVGGRSGTVWVLAMPGSAKGADGFDFVVSSDPDLAPVGRVFAAQFSTSAAMMREMMGTHSPFFSGLEEIFAKGAVIRFSRVLQLESVSHDAVPASDFALPPAVLTRAQYAERAKGAH